MARATIYINVVGLDGMIDAMDRVANPSFMATQHLEEVLDMAYAHTQMQTDIITGRLKASGRTSSDFNGKKWTGKLEYGGADYIPPGYSTPAYYGIYEKARGGQHDFMAGLEVYADKFGDAMTKWFKENI
jgi:hypothetical protein